MPEAAPSPQEQKERLTIETYGDSIKKDGKVVNEDTYLVNDELRLYGVFDGMGGHDAGEVASVTAMDACVEGVKEWDDFGDDDIDIMENSVANLLIHANAEVVRASGDTNMGTTGSVVKLHEMQDGTVYAGIAAVGDSPVYVWRASRGELEIVSGADDAISNDMWASLAFERNIHTEGPPSQEERNAARKEVRSALSRDQLSGPAKFLWDRRNVINQALGSKDDAGQAKEVVPSTALVRLERGDRILVLSDGVSDNVSEQEIVSILRKLDSSEDIANVLIKGAVAGAREGKEKNFRAKSDDTSAVVISVS